MVIKFLQWNAQGIKTKTIDFLNLLETYYIDIALVSETFLKPKECFNIKNYNIERANREPNLAEQNMRGGAAILIKKSLSYKMIKTVANEKIEMVAVKIEIEKTKFLNVVSLYAKPKHKIQNHEWQDLSRNILGNTVWAGDFNAHHISWDPYILRQNEEGRELFSFVEEKEYVLFNDETPTRVKRPNWRNSILDLTFVTTEFSIECNE